MNMKIWKEWYFSSRSPNGNHLSRPFCLGKKRFWANLVFSYYCALRKSNLDSCSVQFAITILCPPLSPYVCMCYGLPSGTSLWKLSPDLESNKCELCNFRDRWPLHDRYASMILICKKLANIDWHENYVPIFIFCFFFFATRLNYPTPLSPKFAPI